MKKQLTIRVNDSLMQQFRKACAVEGLTLSQGLMVVVECWRAGELKKIPPTGLSPGTNTCFSGLDQDTADALFGCPEKYGRCQWQLVNDLIRVALLDGFGAAQIPLPPAAASTKFFAPKAHNAA